MTKQQNQNIAPTPTTATTPAPFSQSESVLYQLNGLLRILGSVQGCEALSTAKDIDRLNVLWLASSLSERLLELETGS
jgi:hypothetical protein